MNKLMNLIFVAGCLSCTNMFADSMNSTNSMNQGNIPNNQMMKNQSMLNNSPYISDQSILQSIRNALRDDKVLSDLGKNVEIAVNNGSVTLTGDVNSDSEKKRVESVATQINGVNKIVNNIKIK